MRSQHKLRKNEQFQEVFKHGRSFANRFLVVYFKPQELPSEFHIGFSVSKKVGKAVVRNRVKRLLKAAIADISEQIDSRFDIVIIARPRVVELEFEEVKKNLIHAFSNAGLFRT
ncbi:ribonuclease P protein component [Fodinisporobacter ferrooxydans]|uniref:Ribonuclease P protein component n=1 Tax=Fodinisporobacter ferrooxydans TaxID=2901836 RepID=A0ABY4CV46_9BACL|nr:ribonuclease P protein component [Alicyclobacillaceae bacterium MYW30-H2]